MIPRRGLSDLLVHQSILALLFSTGDMGDKGQKGTVGRHGKIGPIGAKGIFDTLLALYSSVDSEQPLSVPLCLELLFSCVTLTDSVAVFSLQGYQRDCRLCEHRGGWSHASLQHLRSD